MKIYNIQEAKTHLSRLVEDVARGEEVIIGKYGRPMARMSAFELKEGKRPLGGLESKIRLAEDFDDEDERITAP